MDPLAQPCPAQATVLVVLHDPNDLNLTSVPLGVCDKHLIAIAGQSQLTPERQVVNWHHDHPEVPPPTQRRIDTDDHRH